MAMPTSTQTQALIQEVFILATGTAASAAEMAPLEAGVKERGDFSGVAQAVNAFMGTYAAANGVPAALKAVALNGLGMVLGDAQAAQLVQTLTAQGITSWAALFELCVGLQGAEGSVLDHRAQAAQSFASALLGAGKADFFAGAGVNAAVKNLLQNIGVSQASLANGKQGLDALAANLGAAGIKSAVVDGYVSGATVFVDGNGNGKLDAGEFSTMTDASGNFVLPAGITGGGIVASGGTDLLTGKAFKGTLTAAAGSTVINPITT
ncbi:MAG: hypothetical protein ACMG50_11765, partial [Thermomonas sp.]